MNDSTFPFEFGTIYETILTTQSTMKEPNAAPMGIIFDDNTTVTLKIYNTAMTSKNLLNSEFCVINFTVDPELFTICSLFQEELNETFFYFDEKYQIPILTQCKDNFMILKIEKKKREEERTIFTCEIVEINLNAKEYPYYTRAFSLLLEILILSTRIVAFSKSEKNINLIPDLHKRINQIYRMIKRVIPNNPKYEILLQKIMKKISNNG